MWTRKKAVRTHRLNKLELSLLGFLKSVKYCTSVHYVKFVLMKLETATKELADVQGLIMEPEGGPRHPLFKQNRSVLY